MMSVARKILGGVVLAGLLAGASQAQGAARRLPDRVLTCAIRHITNFDPAKSQTAEQLQSDSVHNFMLRLPPVPMRTKAPPEAFEKPEPVDPRTRILADPDGIAPHPLRRFDKVVDYWPDRVELASTIKGALLNVIVISPIDPAAKTANMFMTRATELTHFDPRHIYQGSCQIAITPKSPIASVDGKAAAKL